MADDVPTTMDLWRQLVINQQEIIELQKSQLVNQQFVTAEIAKIKDILSQAKGGWRTLVIAGSLITGFATLFSLFWTHILNLPSIGK